MATYDFRILLETVEGQKTSYISQSFVDTSQDLVLSASQVYNRITGSVSCSYQNSSFFSGSDFNTSFTFKNNNLLSASLSGSQDIGSIDFDSTDTEYDRLLRYKFFGEKVCNTLGLPTNQWVYVDQIRFPVDDESNIFQGNIEAGNVFIADTLDFANNAKVNSDVPFLIDTGSDRHIKFIDERNFSTLGLIIGYDKSLDTYEISGSDSLNFNIGGVDKLIFSDGTSQTTAGGGGSADNLGNHTATQDLNLDGNDITNVGNISASGFVSASSFVGTLTGQASSVANNLTIGTGLDLNSGTTYNGSAARTLNLDLTEVIASDANNRVLTTDGDGTLTAEAKLSFDGSNLTILGDIANVAQITASGNISSSGTIVANELQDTSLTVNGGVVHTTNGVLANTSGFTMISEELSVRSIANVNSTSHITASGNISSSGDMMATNYKLKSPSGGDEINALTTSGDEIQLGDPGMDDALGLYGQLSYLKIDDGALSFNTNSPTSKVHFHGSDADMFVGSHITASGQISSSGTGNNHFGGPIVLDSTGTIQHKDDADTFILLDTDTISMRAGNTKFLQSADKAQFNQLNAAGYGIVVNGHITASGNISASGTSTGSFGRVEASTLGGTLSTAAQGNITSLGTLTTLTVDDITINGSTISDAGNFTLDTGGSITLDSETGTITMKDTSVGTSAFVFKLDSTPEIDVTGNFTIDGTGDIELNAGGGDIVFKKSSTDLVTIGNGGHITASGNISASGILDASGVTDGLAAAIVAEIDNDEISGDKIEGGTIGSVTITDLTATSLNVTHFTSSFITSSTIQTEGSNIFGDTIADTHTFNGHITASGNISASGTLDITGNVNFDGDLDVDGTTNLDTVDIDGDVSLAGDLDFETSAGRDITFGDNLGAALEFKEAGNLYMRFVTTNGSEGVTLNKGLTATSATFSNNITANGNIVGDGSTDIYGINNISASGHITASGNISASGNINSSQVQVNGTSVVENIVGSATTQGILTVTKAGSDASLQLLNLHQAGNPKFNHITASANISASGNISATGNLDIDGDADIDGTLEADAITIDGDDVMVEFTLTADGGSNQTIKTGNTLDIAGGTNITTAVGATDTVTVNLDASPSVTNITASGIISASGDGDHFIGGRINLNSATAGNQEIKFNGAARIQGNDTFIILDSDNQFVARADNQMNFSTPVFGLGAFDTNDTAGAVLHISGVNATNETLIVEGSDGTDYLTVGLGGHITASGNISASGNLYVDGAGYFNDGLIVNNDGGVESTLFKDNAGGIQMSINYGGGGKVNVGSLTGNGSELSVTGDFGVSSHITASGNISASGGFIGNTLTLDGLSNQGSEATAVMINGSNVVGTRELGSNAFTSTTIGTTTNALTVDNATLQLNSGTTFNGSAARTISVKDGGIDSDALAADISVTSLTSTHITASGNISSSGAIKGGSLDIKNNAVITGSLGVSGSSVTLHKDAALHFGLNGALGGTIQPTAGAVDSFKITSNVGDITLNSAANEDLFISENNNLYAQFDGSARLFNMLGSGSFLNNVSIGGNFSTVPTGDTKLSVIGNISSSGTLISNEINTIGHITASGNISSSGASHTFGGTTTFGTGESDGIKVSNVISHAGDTDTKLNFTPDQLVFTIGNDQVMTLKPNVVKLSAPVTASGNISASGVISGSDVHVTDDLSVGGVLSVAGDIQHVGDTDTKIVFGTDSIALRAGATELFKVTEASPDTISFGAAISSHITASGNISGSATTNLQHGGATIHHVHTFDNGDDTPDVSGGTVFLTNGTNPAIGGGNAHTITTFDGGTAGQIIHVLIEDAFTTFTNGTNLKLFRGINATSLTTNDIISFICEDGTVWREMNRQDNS